MVGHSLGAALSLLDGVYLRVQLNASVSVRVVAYGMPRVGNQDFVNWVEDNLGGDVTHINNEEDTVPIVPGWLLGFHHPSGEAHITDSSMWESCSGELLSPSGVRVRVFGKEPDVKQGVPKQNMMSNGVGGGVQEEGLTPMRDTKESAQGVASQARTILPICASSAMY